MRYLSIAEVRNTLAVAYKESRRDHLMLLFAYTHGLRQSEVAALRLRDVSNGLIRVARVKGSLKTEHGLVATQDVLFDEPSALAAWLEERPQDTDALFPSRKGRSNLTPNSVGRIAVYYLEKAGVAQELAHHHSFKHTCCSGMSRTGETIQSIAQFVGHKDINNTRIYLNITDEEATAARQRSITKLLGE